MHDALAPKDGVLLAYRAETLDLPVTATGRTLASGTDPNRRALPAQHALQDALADRAVAL